MLLTATVNGSIAGLVAITAGCAVMDPPFALLTGSSAAWSGGGERRPRTVPG